MVYRQPSGGARTYRDGCKAWRWRPTSARDYHTRAAPVCAAVHARPGRIFVTLWDSSALPVSSHASIHPGGQRHGTPRGLRASGVYHRAVWRQLELARPHLVPGELPTDRGATEVPLLLWQHVDRAFSDELRAPDDPLGGGHRTVAPLDAHFPTRYRWAASRLRWHTKIPGGPVLA